MATIHILLATYQGEPYLTEFAQSLFRQSHSEWRVLARDDGSRDETRAILDDLSRQDHRILPARDELGRLGPAQNFGRLMELALQDDARYVAFADQDDVWLREKLARQLDALRRLESIFGVETPLLVHSDLTVVDERLEVVHPSFAQHAGVRVPTERMLATLLVSNHVTGCTILANRALIRCALPMPHCAVMHDWWLAQCAAAWGEISFLDAPTVMYRQHGKNVVGGEGIWHKMVAGCQTLPARWKRLRSTFATSVEQAQELHRRLRMDLSSKSQQQAQIVERYCELIAGRSSNLRDRLAAYRLERARLHPLRELALLAKITTHMPVEQRAA